METVAETVSFFEDHLFASPAVTAFRRLTGLGKAAARPPSAVTSACASTPATWRWNSRMRRRRLAALRRAGIRVGKVQVSAGLASRSNPDDRRSSRRSRPFAEGVYLHQVVERRDGRLTRYVDLPEALAAAADDGAGAREWRIHFHVPLFREELGPFASTQDYLAGVLASPPRTRRTRRISRSRPTPGTSSRRLSRREDIADAVARELAGPSTSSRRVTLGSRRASPRPRVQSADRLDQLARRIGARRRRGRGQDASCSSRWHSRSSTPAACT